MARVHVGVGRVLALLALALHGRAAFAAPPSFDASRAPVRLRFDGARCTALRLDDAMPFAEVEVGRRLAAAQPDDEEAILVRCSGDLVTISATTSENVARAYRTDLTRTPPSIRPRIIAIAIAEVVHDLEINPSQRPAPLAVSEPRPESAERPLEVAPPTPLPTAATQLAVFSQADHFQLGNRWLVGGGIRFDYLQPRWSVGLDAALIGRDESAVISDVRTILAYMSPCAAARWSRGPFALRAGGGYAFGVAQITGASNPGVSPDKLTGPWGSPYAFLAGAFAVSDIVTLEVRGLAGWVNVSVVGQVEGGGDVALKGFWSSAQLGIALAL